MSTTKFRTSLWEFSNALMVYQLTSFLPRTQALWFVYVIKLIHAAHAKAAQAIEQHIAPGYEADFLLKYTKDILLRSILDGTKIAAMGFDGALEIIEIPLKKGVATNLLPTALHARIAPPEVKLKILICPINHHHQSVNQFELARTMQKISKF